MALCIVGLGAFYLGAIILGFLLFPGIYPQLVTWISQGPVGVGLAKNMAVLEMSFRVGGTWLMAIGAAGAVAAILSTSAGLMITVASSVSHDLYKVYINPNATEKQELGIAKITTVLMSSIAVSLAVLLKDENIAWLVMLAFGIAASAIFPAMLATLWWKRATRQAIIASILTGLAVSVVFIVLLFAKGPAFTILGLPVGGGPGLFGVVASSLVLLTVTMLTSDTGKMPRNSWPRLTGRIPTDTSDENRPERRPFSRSAFFVFTQSMRKLYASVLMIGRQEATLPCSTSGPPQSLTCETIAPES